MSHVPAAKRPGPLLPPLPPLPQTLMRVWQVIDNPDCTPGLLSEAICADTSLVASLLRAANSAHYGRPQQVTAIPEAVLLLGLRTIKRICTSTVIRTGLFPPHETRLRPHRARLWRHCLATGLMAESLADEMRLPSAAAAFSHGLLHDVGLVIRDRFHHEDVAAAAALQAQGMPFVQAELEIFGADHATFGADIAQHWNLPASLQGAIARHCWPPRLPGHELEAVVSLACLLTETESRCHPGGTEQTFQELAEFLRLDGTQVRRASERSARRFTDLAEAFEI